MSTPTTIQGNQVPILISTDDITYRSIVCNRAWDLNVDNSVNQEETDCGTFTALGAVKWSFNFEGLLNTTPNGSTEISAKTLLDYAVNQTLTYIKAQIPAGVGTSMYAQGQGYVSNLKVTKATGQLIAFSATFTGSGTLDNTP